MFSKILRNLERRAAALGARSRLWAAVYYLAFSRAYRRDQQAFLAGRTAYAKSLAVPLGTMSLLRRNIHRIEKGLLMRPMRTPFARDYISQTVECYLTAIRHAVDPAELAWARDVLHEYFDKHWNEQDAAWRERFEQASHPQEPGDKRIPYLREPLGEANVTYDELMKLARHRRSVRWFLPTPVPRSDIDRAINLGAQAPSACNRQPFEFRVLDDPDLVRKTIEIPYGTVGFAHNVPVVAIVVGKQRHFCDERDRHLIYIDASLAVMGLLYALEVQGISSCCINWPDLADKEQQMSALLKLAADERPVMLIAIGYADPEGLVANSSKKSVEQLRKYNFE